MIIPSLNPISLPGIPAIAAKVFDQLHPKLITLSALTPLSPKNLVVQLIHTNAAGEIPSNAVVTYHDIEDAEKADPRIAQVWQLLTELLAERLSPVTTTTTVAPAPPV